MQATRDGAGAAEFVLDYDDPLALGIDPDMVIRQARHRREARWVAVGLVVLIAGTAGLVVRFGPASRRGGQTPADLGRILATAPLYHQYPPAGPPVVVDTSVPGWQTVVWVSTNGGLCQGPVGVSGDQRGHVLVGCELPFSYPVAGDGTPEADRPFFEGLPAWEKDDGAQVLAMGFAHTGVARVSMVFLGTPASAVVKPVTADGRVVFGVYAIWLSPHGATSYGSADVTDLVAYDASGRTIG